VADFAHYFQKPLLFNHVKWLQWRMIKNKSRFQHYLTRLGDAQASERFSITRRSAQAYRLGERNPKFGDIPVFIERARGHLTYSCFFEAAND
jgi:hypothetical protein